MALDFPNPALQTPRDEFSPNSTPAASTNGVTYVWDGLKWVASFVNLNDVYVEVAGDNMTGNLTLGTDKITLNTDGSAEFQGNVDVGNLDTSSNSTAGVRIAAATGAIQLQRSTASTIFTINQGDTRKVQWSADGYLVISDTNYTTPSITLAPDAGILIGGVQPSAPNISLNANGSARFEDRVTVVTTDSHSVVAYARGDTNDQSAVFARNFNTSNTGDVFRGLNNDGDTNITLKADGSAEFAGDVQVGNNVDAVNTNIGAGIAPLGIFKARRAGDDILWYGFQTGVDPETSKIRADGSAQFNKDIQSTSQNGGPLAGFRNLLINGDFRIWQRGATFELVSSPRFTADRWRTGADRGVDRVAFYNKYGAKCTVAPTGSPLIGQPIEIDVPGRPGPLVEGQQYTFSCVVKNAAAANVSLNIQHRITSDDNTGAQEIVPTTVIGSDVLNPETLSFTFTYTSAMRPSADKTCTYVEISADNRTSEMTITNIQLEPGPVATPFEHRPIGTELALCQRYYQNFGSGMPGSPNANTNNFTISGKFPVEMRATPSVGVFNSSIGVLGIYGPEASNDIGNTTVNSINLTSIRSSGINRVRVNIAATTVRGVIYCANNNFLYADAEL